MDIAKCCKNCKWLEKSANGSERYRSMEYFCLMTGMTMLSKDIEKDLTKYQFTTKWAQDNCGFKPDTPNIAEYEAKSS